MRIVLPGMALLLSGFCHAETYAVLVGVSQYGDKLRLSDREQLKSPATDAYGVYRVLLSRGGGNLQPKNALLLTDQQVTRAALADAIESWLPSKNIGPADTVVVYLSGHGYLEANTGYFVPHDAEQGRIAETSYSTARLFDKLAGLKAGSVLLLTDACHSGSLNERADDLNKALTQSNRHAIISLAATSAAKEEALEFRRPGDQHTVFSEYVIRGLEGGADSNCDNQVSAEELTRYVHSLVKADSGGRQAPSYRIPPGREQTTLWRGSQTACVAGSEFGHLLLNVEGPATQGEADYAVVRVDGSVVGAIAPGPLRIRGLRSGTRLVEVFQRDSSPAVQNVVVRPGHEAAALVKLMPLAPLPPKAEQQLAEARKLYEKGGRKAYQEALALLASAEQLAPGRAKIAYETGLVHQALEQLEEARTAFATALQRNPALREARVLSADLTQQPGESIRQLETVHAMLENDYYSATALARAYQRAGLCTEGLRWARKGGAVYTGDPQAEPLIEAGMSLVKCGLQSEDRAWRQEHLSRAAAAFQEALSRVKLFEGNKQRCVIGRNVFGIAWCQEAAKQEQAKALRYRARKGLTYAELLVGNACAAADHYRAASEEQAHERQRMTFLIHVAGASSADPCSRQRFTWPQACEMWKGLPGEVRKNPQVAASSNEIAKRLSLSTCQ